MTALRATERQDDFSSGMVRDVAPELIPANGALDLVNALLDEDGNPYRRGGTEYLSNGLESAAVLDDFNRANENPVSQGGNWDGPVGYVGLPEFEKNLKVVGEQLASAGGAASGSAVYDVTATDCIAYVTVGTFGAAVAPSLRLFARTAEEGSYLTLKGYELLVEYSSAAEQWTWTLNKIIPELVRWKIGSTSHRSPRAGDSIAISAVGDQITAWLKQGSDPWQLVLGAVDSTYTEGRIAVAVGPEAVRLDGFGGGAVTPFSDTGLNWLWSGHLQPGSRVLFASASDYGVLGEKDEQVNLGGSGLAAPVQSAVLEDLLFIGGNAIYGGSRKSAEYSGGTIGVTNGSKIVAGTSTAFTANVDPGMLIQIGNERVYVVASVESSTKLTLRDAYLGTTGTGKSYSATPLYSIGTDPYEAWEYVAVCANRLVVAQGNVLKFTEVNNPHTFTNSLGTTNEHTLPEGVQIVGLATVGQTVLIFTTAGIWTLDGLAFDIVDRNGNPQHRLQQLSASATLASAAGLAGSLQQLVVPAVDGIYLMDGVSQPIHISGAIDNLYRQRISEGFYLGRAAVYRGHYLLPLIKVGARVKEVLVCRIDRSIRTGKAVAYPWSRFTGDGGEIAAFAVRSLTSPKESDLLGAQSRTPSQVELCSPYFSPDSSHEVDADGSCHDLEITGRDLQTGSQTVNAVRALKPRYELAGQSGSSLMGSFSDGSQRSGGARFGHAQFGHAQFSGTGASFAPIGESGASDGRTPAKFRVNKTMRFFRPRFKTSGPIARFALRAFEVTMRPSGATRR